jgi:hypothetical protein
MENIQDFFQEFPEEERRPQEFYYDEYEGFSFKLIQNFLGIIIDMKGDISTRSDQFVGQFPCP